MHAMKGPYSTAPTKALQSRHLAATDGGNIRMISEGCSNAGSILDHFVLFHPDIELLDFGDPKIFQMCRRLFESRFCSLFPRIRAAADQTDDSIQNSFDCLLLLVFIEENLHLALHSARGVIRDSPDRSRTGVNIRVFSTLSQDTNRCGRLSGLVAFQAPVEIVS